MKRFLYALGCFCGVASADTPLPFGLDLQSADWIGTLQVIAETDATRTGELDEAVFALDVKQRELGPYHPDLVAPTLAAAALATETGALARAEQLYDRALHTVRVNDGLYGDQQLPILRGLLDLYLFSGDREGFERRADYQFKLLGSGVPPFNSAELSAAAEFFDVTLDALMNASWEGKSRELLRFHDRVEALTEAVCGDSEFGMDWCQRFSFRLVRFYYLLEYKLDVFVDDPRFEPRFSDTDWQLLDREPRLEALQRRLFQRGERVFDRLLALKPADHDALSALADWHWFYQKRPAAISYYQTACKLRPDRFSYPAPLPEYPALSRYRAFREIGAVVGVTLEVNNRGVPSDIVLASADGEGPRSLKRKLRATRFRPGFDNCDGPRAVSVLNGEFVLLD